MASAARTPTIATTIINSTRVKPRFAFRVARIFDSPWLLGWILLSVCWWTTQDHHALPISPACVVRAGRVYLFAFVLHVDVAAQAVAHDHGVDAVASAEIGP